MEPGAALALILGSVVLGAMSPGPSLVYVSRLAMARSRRHAMAAALGMGVGGVTFAIAASAGLGAVLHYAEWAFLAVKILGGGYLLSLGVRMWMHAGHPPAAVEAPAELGGWRGIVAWGFSTSRPRTLYAHFSAWIDRLAGTVLGGLGAWFAIDGIRTAVR
jgi:threonine/homoserine/homoserine lactone efflux protein